MNTKERSYQSQSISKLHKSLNRMKKPDPVPVSSKTKKTQYSLSHEHLNLGVEKTVDISTKKMNPGS